jgi:gas vesicle protein
MSERNGDFIKGLLIGGLIGAVVGILYAPKSGKETREDIARKADELAYRAKEEYEKAIEKSKLAYEATVKRLKDLESSAKDNFYKAEEKVSEFAHNSAETIAENKNRLKKAIDAGTAAYREEKAKNSEQ